MSDFSPEDHHRMNAMSNAIVDALQAEMPSPRHAGMVLMAASVTLYAQYREEGDDINEFLKDYAEDFKRLFEQAEPQIRAAMK